MKTEGSGEAELPSSGEKRAMASEEMEKDEPLDLKKQRVDETTADETIADETSETTMEAAEVVEVTA